MKKINILFCLLFLTNLGFAQFSIIPKPVSEKIGGGTRTLGKEVSIQTDFQVSTSAEFLQETLKSLADASVNISSDNIIKLSVDPAVVKEKEGYLLDIERSAISITGHDPSGVFYGIQSLIQLLNQSDEIPLGSIYDYPRFAYRGLHLDVSRHMFPLEFIKKYLDLMAVYKLNTFHWHLTDDQGWRIEIKQYPKLQSVAAYRDETIIGHKRNAPHRFDGQRYGGYYTQEEVKEIVSYAERLNINVIPEIEMPGHASSVLAAYPELGCLGEGYKTATFWGIFDDVFCAGNEEVFNFLENVLDEVLELFPSKFIHIGGDECPKTRWKACEKCQTRIAEEGLKDEDELQSYFIHRMERYLNAKGREIIGWDEILEGGLSPNATVMSWRGEAGGIESALQEHYVVMTPDPYLYFDYYQSLQSDEPTAAAWFTPLEKVYSYDPVPLELGPEFHQYILGVQANVWTEYMKTPEHVEYMTFPRALAMAEVAWSPKERKDYDDFLVRLRKHEDFLKQKEINYFPRYEEIKYQQWMGQQGEQILSLNTSLPDAEIYYTLDGSEPDTKSHLYSDAIVQKNLKQVKSRVFSNGKPYGKVLELNYLTHKALGKNVSVSNTPSGNFNPTLSNALTNGLTGNARFNNGQWLGFLGEDFEAVVDLESTEIITELGINILKLHWQRMWEPTELIFYVSGNGKTFKEVYRTSDFPENAINEVRAKIKPTKARYIKVYAKNKSIIPEGKYGAGGKPWLLVDEIIIN